MSSTGRVLAILDLFTVERPTWTPDEINAALDYSRPTGYRYVKELVDAGLLRKVAAGAYTLGPRIIQLDYQIRQTDPVLRASIPIMESLVSATGFDAVLSAMIDDRLIDIHRVSRRGENALQLRYGRGRPRPPFRGAAAKILAAYLSRALQVRLYAKLHADAAAAGLGDTWDAFRAELGRIRKAGHYRSLGELEPEVGGLGVPVHDPSGDVVAALTLVGTVAAVRGADERRLAMLLTDGARRIRERVGQAPDGPSRPAARSAET